jgi:CubicO group peptidase (beta-lactamase class C family)
VGFAYANFDPIFLMRRIARRLGLRVGPSSRDIARFMVGEPLQFTPGTQEHNSNFGYVMLGLVAEKAAASAFHDLVRDQVAAPLGIDRVSVPAPAGINVCLVKASMISPAPA